MDALLKGFEIVARHLFLVAFSTVMFCRVCGFRVSAWDSYRTSRSFGYGYGSVTELTEVPCNVARSYRTHRSSGRVQKNSAPSPRVLWHGAYRNHRSSGYGYECRTELTEVLCTGMDVLQNSQKFRVLVIPAGEDTPSGEELDLKWKISSNLNMACSHWANIPEEIRSCVGIIDTHHRGDES